MSIRNSFTVAVVIGALVLSSVGAGLVVGQSHGTAVDTTSTNGSTSEQETSNETSADTATHEPTAVEGPEPYATGRWNASFTGDPGGSAIGTDGTVYLGVTTHRDYDQRTGRLAAYNPTTGDVRWTRGGLGGFTAGPTVADGTVYAATDAKVSSSVEPADGAGGLYAFDAETGATEWVRNTSEKWTGTPILADGKLYAIRGPETVEREPDSGERPLVGNRSLVALDPDTGTTTWSVPADGLVGIASGTVVATDGRRLVAYDLSTHERQWNVTRPRAVNDRVATIGSDAAYVLSKGSPPQVRSYALTDGDVRWNVTVGTPESTAFRPTVADGSLFVTTTDETSSVVRLDASNGTEQWRFDRPVGDLRSSPAVGNDTVYVSAAALSEREEPGGEALLPYQRSPAVIALDEANGSEQWGYLGDAVATDSEFDLQMEQPAVVDGGLYLTAADSFMDSELAGGLLTLESARTPPTDAHTPTDGIHEDDGARPSVTITTNTTDPSETFGENETVRLTADASVTGGELASREWDVDDDGTFERNGTSITVTLEQCEERDITAKVTTSRNETAEETVTIKNAA